MNWIHREDVERARLGLTNKQVFTAHPEADRVLKELWKEVSIWRSEAKLMCRGDAHPSVRSIGSKLIARVEMLFAGTPR